MSNFRNTIFQIYMNTIISYLSADKYHNHKHGIRGNRLKHTHLLSVHIVLHLMKTYNGNKVFFFFSFSGDDLDGISIFT